MTTTKDTRGVHVSRLDNQQVRWLLASTIRPRQEQSLPCEKSWLLSLLRCPLCAACTHSCKCNCLHYTVGNLVCCHIHAVNLAELPKEAMTIPDEAVDGVAEKRERA